MTLAASDAPPAQPASATGGMAPGPWLRELVRIKPAPWPWGQAIRAALGIGVPWTIGYLNDAALPALWVALGAMMATTAEPVGAYRAKIGQIAVSGAIGALGFFAGLLAALPWGLVVAAMAVAGFAGGVVSSWGSKFSLGAMQFLLVAAIAIAMPDIAPFWQPALLYAGGAALQLALLAVESAIVRDRPERARIAAVAAALGALAGSRAGRTDGTTAQSEPPGNTPRRAVTDALAALAVDALSTRARIVGRSTEAEAMAAIIARGDMLFAGILGESDPAALARAAARLSAAAGPLAAGRDPAGPSLGTPGTLDDAVSGFLAAARGGTSGNPFTSYIAAAEPRRREGSVGLTLLLGRLVPGASVLRGALALALCMAVAYAAAWLRLGAHWFWVPLTVTLVMKPDLGSVFARAVLRSLGTVAGAAVGAAMLAFVPRGPEMAVLITLLALLLPWAMRPSYAVQALVMTPLVLVLISAIAPGPPDVDLAVQRIIDTGIGSLIVLVFGYFVWPRRHQEELTVALRAVKRSVAAYLQALAVPGDADGSPPDVARLRRVAYGQLSDFRSRLQVLMVEPPPASREATAWFPLLTGIERICDRITAFSGASSRPLDPADAAAVQAVAERIAMAPRDRAKLPPLHYAGSDTAVAALVDGVGAELRHLARIQEDGVFPGPPSVSPGFP